MPAATRRRTATTLSTGSSSLRIPTELVEQRTYDFRNNVVTETDQAGNVTKYVIRSGRPGDVGHAGLRHIECHHHRLCLRQRHGRKITETDALSHATSYTYDAAGRPRAISGVKGNFSYGYDNARNRTR
jgi:YD repeat-containing protein